MKVPHNFGMATVCRPGKVPNKSWKPGRGKRQCLTEKKKELSLKELQRLAKKADVSIYKRRKDGMGFTISPLSMKTLRARLTRMKVPHNFGMATVCRPGKVPNKSWKPGRGKRQCLTEKKKELSLKELQRLAKKADVSIYKRRKDDMGFTKTPLSAKSLKARLTRMKVKY
jgi:predicted phosphohydrolase